ncbi:MAG: branched-chain amino acid transaminase [Parvularculaceae bacterium]|nr:branched-chain amino acid transaminase [Parvularculaceae bacterium]
MGINATTYIWMDGALKPWGEASVHVMTHALHYGTSFFEGIRVYETPEGPTTFRLEDHIDRLYDSAAIYGCAVPFERATLIDACDEVVTANRLISAYLRPIVFYGYGEIGPTPTPQLPVHVAIAACPFGAYLGEGSRAAGVDICVSSWRRPAPDTIPTAAKAGGNYLSSVLISSEAKQRGFAEGVGLDVNGLVSEGAGENLFLVRKGKIFTPPSSASILQGITRDTVMTLAREDGIEVVEQALPREALYLADEIFMTGTAAEITPVRSVDHRPVRAKGRGPVTKMLQERFFGLFDGSTKDQWGWLHRIENEKKNAREAAIAV